MNIVLFLIILVILYSISTSNKKFIKSTKIHRWYHKDQIDKYSTKLIEIIVMHPNNIIKIVIRLVNMLTSAIS